MDAGECAMDIEGDAEGPVEAATSSFPEVGSLGCKALNSFSEAMVTEQPLCPSAIPARMSEVHSVA